MPPALVLASASPRRLDLLRQIGLVPTAVEPADIDETPRVRELAPKLAPRLAAAKCALVAARYGSAYVLAADTVVAVGRRILPKAETAAEAALCLDLLSGRRHRVLTAICIAAPGGRIGQRLVTSVVRFKRLTMAERAAYLAAGEWRGKAGGYAAQGLAAAFIADLSGSYSNVIGLPLHETANLLGGFGYPVVGQWPTVS